MRMFRFARVERHITQLASTFASVSMLLCGGNLLADASPQRALSLSAAKLSADAFAAFRDLQPGNRLHQMDGGIVSQMGNRVRVVVNLTHRREDTFPARGYAGLQRVLQSVRTAQDQVLDALPAGDVEGVLRLSLQHAFSGWVTEAGLRRLQVRPDVVSIVPDYLNRAFTVQGRALATSDYAASSLGYTGSGVTCAMIDTAFDYTHMELGGGSIGSPNSAVIVGSYDFSGSDLYTISPDAEVYPEGGDDDAWHGTGTAGIVRRYAPSARLALLKVFPNSYDSVIANAINWTVTNKNIDPSSPIELINMSLGGGQYSGDCPSGTMQSAIDNAKAAGVISVVAAGNNGWTSYLAEPGCDPDVIGVGSVFDVNNAYYQPFPPAYCTDSNRQQNERICYSNASPALDIYAPSEEVWTALALSASHTGTTRLGGTSSAAPATAGSCAQILQAKPSLKGNKNGLLPLLQNTGDAIINNPNPAYQNKRIDVTAAILDSVPGPTITSFTATPSTIAPGGSSTLSWSCTNTTSVTISGVAGTFAASGSTAVSPVSTTTYTLTAAGPGGTAQATTTVTVSGSPTPVVDSFTATPATIAPGGTSTLSWACSNTTSVTISGVAGSFGATGTTPVSPATTTLYTLTATGPGGSATASTTVTVSGGGGGVLSVAPLDYDFGSITVGGSSAPHPFTVSNTGTASLLVGTLSLTGVAAADFTILTDSASGQVIAPGASRSFQVSFHPWISGLREAAVFVPSDAGSAAVTIRGTGVSSDGVDLTGSWVSLKRRGSSLRARLSVTNAGTSAAGSFKVASYLSKDATFDAKDKSAGSKTFSGAAAGSSSTVMIKTTARRAYHYLIAVIDSADAVVETDESNNTITSARF